ncbi:MAG: HAMP domain-containing protein, partial [Gemmatimonadetes bacterium]|nr:HAMP domain-containing protein [Gemmatimonadota bacterium]
MSSATREHSGDVAEHPHGSRRHGERFRSWLRPTIAKKVGLLLFLVTCGGALALAAFLWYQREQTVDGQLIALSSYQASLADQLPMYGRLVVLGAEDAQQRLRSQARSFEAMLTLLREGGDLGFWHLPPPAADLRAVLDRTMKAWQAATPALQAIVDTPIGTPTLEAANAQLAAASDVLAETQRELQLVAIGRIVARDIQMRWLLSGVLGADLLLFGLGLLLSRRFIARPIQLLRDATTRVAAGDVHQPVPVMTGDELGALAEGFNMMSAELDRLHEVETQLRQTQKLEAVGQLAAGIAHDFNNLLQGIGGYTALLLDQHPVEAGPRADLEQIRHLVQRGAGLTRQLLIFGRRGPLTAQPLHLQTHVRQGAEFLRRLIREDVLLEVGPDPEAGWIQADPGQIDQVLMNLATNAQDAMPHGGRLTLQTGTLRVIDPVPTRPGLGPGDYVTLAVRDTGTGMDETTRARIFEPFFTTKDIGQGTGLG